MCTQPQPGESPIIYSAPMYARHFICTFQLSLMGPLEVQVLSPPFHRETEAQRGDVTWGYTEV